MNKVAMHGDSNLQRAKRWGPGRAGSWIMFMFNMISDMVEAHYSSLAHAFQLPLDAVILDPSDTLGPHFGLLNLTLCQSVASFSSAPDPSLCSFQPPLSLSLCVSALLWHEIPSGALILLFAAFD